MNPSSAEDFIDTLSRHSPNDPLDVELVSLAWERASQDEWEDALGMVGEWRPYSTLVNVFSEQDDDPSIWVSRGRPSFPTAAVYGSVLIDSLDGVSPPIGSPSVATGMQEFEQNWKAFSKGP